MNTYCTFRQIIHNPRKVIRNERKCLYVGMRTDDACDLTSNVLQCDGDTRCHLPWGPKGPVTQLLICTNTWATHTRHTHIVSVLNPYQLTVHLVKVIHDALGSSSIRHCWLIISKVLPNRRCSLWLHTYLQYQMTLAVNGWNMMRELPPL